MAYGSIEDRLAIRELIESFSGTLACLDTDAWIQNWAEDGAWKLRSLPEDVVGRDAILATFVDKMSPVKAISMISYPNNLSIDGDTATGIAYCREIIELKTGDRKELLARFHDNYVRVDGEWKFARREYEVFSVM